MANAFRDQLPNLDISPSFETKDALEESPLKTSRDAKNKGNNRAARFMNDFFNLPKEQ